MEKRIIQVEEKVPVKLLIPLSIQHMFAMFGASVLVPFLFGISPAIVLFMNGIGTLLFIAITKGKAPAYLGSSFAFLAPASIVIQNFGYEYALGGFVAVGFCACNHKTGSETLENQAEESGDAGEGEKKKSRSRSRRENTPDWNLIRQQVNKAEPISLEDEMKRSYLDYAMSVIMGRALPDVRDGLKPVHGGCCE